MMDTLLAALVARGQAPLAGYLARFLDEYGARTAPLALGLALVGSLVGLLWARSAPPDEAWSLARGRRLRLLGCALAALAAAGFQAAVLGRIPREPDEASYLFEARLVLRAEAAAPDPGPEVVALVDLPFSTTRNGRWFCAFPPGWPLLLALGEGLGQPWLVNPLLAALNLWLLGLWIERRFDPATATAAVLLGSLSPFFLVLHGTLMADPLCLALCLACALAVEEGESPGRASLAAGAALAVRPAAGFFVGPLLLWGLLRPPSPAGPGRVARLLPTALGFAPAFGLLAAWNAAALGDPFTWTYTAAAPGFGFGPVGYQGATLVHDLLAGLVGAGMNAAALGVDLLGLAGLAWIPLLLGLPAVLRAGGPMPLAGASLLVGHLFYFHPGLAYGPRFWLPGLALLLAAAALGFRALLAAGGAPASGLPRLLVALAPAMLLGWWLPASIQLDRHAGTDPLPPAVCDLRRPPGDRMVVFVPAVGYPERPLDRAFLGRLDPFLDAPVIYLRDPGDPESRGRVARHLARTGWIFPWP